MGLVALSDPLVRREALASGLLPALILPSRHLRHERAHSKKQCFELRELHLLLPVASRRARLVCYPRAQFLRVPSPYQQQRGGQLRFRARPWSDDFPKCRISIWI